MGEVVDRLVFQVTRTGDASGRGVDRLSKSLKGLRGASGEAHKGLSNLLHTMTRIGRMMILRQAIRALLKAFTEGLENVYKFNSMMGGELSAALDRLKSASVQATGAIGSAFGELLATLAPILISILNLITKVANAIAQLFAVLGGRSTYTKAVASSQKWADATSQGAKAAEEWKNQLMGFDEINRLEEPNSGSGGGGGGSAPYDGAYELAPAVNEWASELRRITLDWWHSLDLEPITKAWERLTKAVKDFVSIVDDALYWAYTEVLLPLAGWTIEKGAPTLLNLLASQFEFLNAVLRKLAPYMLSFYETVIKPIAEFMGNAFVRAVEWLTRQFEGLTEKIEKAKSLDEFLKSLSFGESLLLGLATAVTAVATAFAAWRTVTSIVSTVGSIIGLLSNPVGIAIAAITALVVAGIGLYQSWDTIVPGMKKAWGDFKDWVHSKTDAMVQKFEEFMRGLHDKFVQPLLDWITSVQEWFDNIKKAISEAVGGIIGKLFGVKSETTDTKISFVNDMNDMSASIFNVYDNGSLLGSLASAFESLGHRAHAALQDIITGLGTVIGHCIDALHALNDVANERARYNESTGALYSTTPEDYSHATRRATGGFVDSGELFMARENGLPEMVGRIGNHTAVANNDQIIQGISNGVYSAVVSAMSSTGGNNTPVNIYLDGSIIARSTTKYQRQYARAGTM